MAKTSKQIQGDIYNLLKGSALCSMISGDVYRSGYRPRDSRLEDAVVIFTTGLPDQIQTGVVTVNIYVPDIDPYQNGVLVEDGERTETIAARPGVGGRSDHRQVLLQVQAASDHLYRGRAGYTPAFHRRKTQIRVFR